MQGDTFNVEDLTVYATKRRFVPLWFIFKVYLPLNFDAIWPFFWIFYRRNK